jgi:hemerythrin
MANFRASPTRFRVHDVYQLLANWLVDHVLGEDMKIRPFVAHLEEAQAA